MILSGRQTKALGIVLQDIPNNQTEFTTTKTTGLLVVTTAGHIATIDTYGNISWIEKD